jgi:hypothetical protein
MGYCPFFLSVVLRKACAPAACDDDDDNYVIKIKGNNHNFATSTASSNSCVLNVMR